MEIRQEALRLLLHHVKSNPETGAGLRVAPRQTLSRLPFLSVADRAALGALDREVLAQIGSGGIRVLPLSNGTGSGCTVAGGATVSVVQDYYYLPSGHGQIQALGTPRSEVVSQLTGGTDYMGRMRQGACNSQINYGVAGTDIGASFVMGGDIVFLFGDTAERAGGAPPLNPLGSDCIARISINQAIASAHNNQCMPIEFYYRFEQSSSINVFQPITIWDTDGTLIMLGGTNYPTGGFEHNGDMYIFYATDSPGYLGITDPHRTVLAKRRLAPGSDAPDTTFDVVRTVSQYPDYPLPNPTQNAEWIPKLSSFVSCQKVWGKDVGMDAQPYLFMWGSGWRYRASFPYLAYVPLDQVDDASVSFSYFVQLDSQGAPVWSPLERDARPLFEQYNTVVAPNCFSRRIGELSVVFNPFLNKWLMLYNFGDCGIRRGINCRYADYPWGPWIELDPSYQNDSQTFVPGMIYGPRSEAGYGQIMYDAGVQAGPQDTLIPRDPVPWGGEYAPMMIPSLFTGVGKESIIYYTMSTWNPYQVLLMRSTLRLNCA